MNEKDQAQIDKLDAEIDSASAAVGLVQPEPTTPDQVDSPLEQQGLEEPAVVVDSKSFSDTTVNQDVAPQPQPDTTGRPQQRRSWKKDFQELEARYTKLRQASDRFKYEAKSEVANLQTSVLGLQKENEALKKSLAELTADSAPNIASVFTEEDVNILGESTIGSFQKAVDSAVSHAVNPLQSELLRLKKAERDRLRTQAESNQSAARATFRSMLGRLVPDYATINTDSGFNNWLREQDPYNGAPRINFFKAAEREGDVERVAQFFVEYKQLTQAPENLLEENVSPLGGGGGAPITTPSADGGPKVFTMSFINQFYEDDINGLYKGKEALRDQLDREIDEALGRPGGVINK